VRARAEVQIRTATAHDAIGIAALLRSAGLPAIDAAAFRAEHFRVAQRDAQVVGTVGLERYDEHGLLRSLVVAADARGYGVGDALVDALETHARTLGLHALVLLTTTAEPFFRQRGYASIAREAMPASVQRSSEFSSVCPASAVCMRKELRGATR
jgi:amino-acid N-acetyltransferase